MYATTSLLRRPVISLNKKHVFDAVRTCVTSTGVGTSDPSHTSKSPVKLSPNCIDTINRILRVDHAGELGADRIYAGQMAVLGKTSVGPVIEHMWEQEKEHLATFKRLIPQYRARPSALVPLWNIAGFALGAGSALLGKEAAMACTVAVESVITDHYNSQIRQLLALEEYESSPEIRSLAETITRFRDEEMEHHDTGLEHDAKNAPAYPLLSTAIKGGCKAAVWVAERV